MASYNWGEHRVVGKLKSLIETGDMAGEVASRSYWRFYTQYGDRMPEETKDYVARIFAASVIGENPSLFGFDELKNPLRDYLATSEPRTPRSSDAGSAHADGG